MIRNEHSIVKETERKFWGNGGMGMLILALICPTKCKEWNVGRNDHPIPISFMVPMVSMHKI